jgi:large exoprotein involved in heme utilization and adhesion
VLVIAGTAVHADSFGSQAGAGVSLRASDRVQLIGGSTLTSDSHGAESGAVEVTAKNLQILGGATVSSRTLSQGKAGTVTVTADTLTIDGSAAPDRFTGIRGATASGSAGDAGTVTVDARSVSISSGGEISSDTFGSGRGGGLFVRASDTLTIDGSATPAAFTGISSDVYQGSGGGEVEVTAQNLQILGGGTISSRTLSQGRAGTLTVLADALTIDGSATPGQFTGIRGAAVAGSTGNAGDVMVHAHGDLSVLGSGQISSDTFGGGRGGDVSVKADDTLTIDGSATPALFTGISSDVYQRGRRGGKVVADARNLQVLGGGTISSRTLSRGRAGTVTVTADALTVDGSAAPGRFTGIRGAAATGSTGNAGEVTVNALGDLKIVGSGQISSDTFGRGHGGPVTVTADTMLVSDGGSVSARSTGTGEAGHVIIFARDRIELRNASIATDAENADGGSIDLQTRNLVDLFDSHITADVDGGTGGNISIDPTFVVLDHSSIEANASAGPGGKIRILAGYLFREDSIISASGGDPSLSGTVTINAAQTNVVGAMTALPASFVDPSQFLRERCAARQATPAAGSFVVLSGEGAPPSPEGLLPAAVLANGGPTASLSEPAFDRASVPAGQSFLAASCP